MFDLVEIFRATIRAITKNENISRDQFCDAVNDRFPEATVDPAKVRHYLGDQAHLFANPLAVAAEAAAMGYPELLQAVANAAGYNVIKRRDVAEPVEVSATNAASSALLEESLLVTGFLEAIRDGKVDDEEWEDLVSKMTRCDESREALLAVAREMRTAG